MRARALAFVGMPVVGDILADRYRIESILGVGGMASVYRSTDLRLDRQVAVKVLAANLAADAQFAERFSREAGAMAGFSHPNVAAVYDVDLGDPTTGREPFYVMEYCPNGSLADRLKSGKRLPPAELIPIVDAVSEGLAELHRNGLIHRDVKPANILFTNNGAKLADFGVAWSQGPRDGDPLTLPGSTIGTAPYLAPELKAGDPPSVASDVYALGVTIFQALTGRYPGPETGTGAGDAPPASVLQVSAAAPDLGQRFDEVLSRALDEAPGARPSPVEFAAQLTTRLETWGIARPNPAAAVPDPQRGGASDVDTEAPTRVAQELPTPARPAVATPQRPGPDELDAPPQALGVAPPPAGPSRPMSSPRRRADYRGLAIVAAALVVAAVLVAPALLGDDPGFQSEPPAASVEASPTASATVLATPRPNENEAALLALSQVDREIEAARGGPDGLKGRDGNELEQLANAVRTSVDGGDLDTAADAAQALSDRARALAADLDESRRDPLLAAIDGLLEALSPN